MRFLLSCWHIIAAIMWLLEENCRICQSVVFFSLFLASGFEVEAKKEMSENKRRILHWNEESFAPH